MAGRKKTDLEDNENKELNAPNEEFSSGAELYTEPPEEQNTSDDIKSQEQAVEEMPEQQEEESSSAEPDEFADEDDLELEDEEIASDTSELGDTQDNKSYEEMKQDLLQEYDSNKNTYNEEQEEDSDFKEDNFETASQELEKEKKIDTDEELEIEDVQESLDNGVISKPSSMYPSGDINTPDVDSGTSKVAVSKTGSIAFLVGVVVLLGYIIYKMFQPTPEELEAQKSSINKNAPIVSPVEDVGQTIVVPEIPKFPDMPTELPTPAAKALPTPPTPPTLDVAPIAPPPAPMDEGQEGMVGLGGLSAPDIKGFVGVGSLDKDVAAEAARKQARIKSSMLIASGGGGNSANKNTTKSGQSLSILERNNDQIAATYIGELQRVIASGKVIDAVLETAINTDLPGMIRAVVSRDVYSEAGQNILINKGSRLIGSYSSSIKFGQARVQIIWDRVIRPDGIDVKIDSPGIDDIGRAGVGGEVDNHILRNFATAMLVSLIDVGIAEYAENNGGSSSSTTTTTVSSDGGSTTVDDSTAKDQAYDEAVDNISSIGKDVMEKTMDMPPTITINQGTSVKVFVKQDIIFPGRSANLTRMVE